MAYKATASNEVMWLIRFASVIGCWNFNHFLDSPVKTQSAQWWPRWMHNNLLLLPTTFSHTWTTQKDSDSEKSINQIYSFILLYCINSQC